MGRETTVRPTAPASGRRTDKHLFLLAVGSKYGVAMRTGDAKALGRSMVELALEKEITFLAGSIAFFAFVSLVPAMVLVLAAGAVLGGEEFAAGLVGLVESSLSAEGTEVLRTALADTTGLAGASAIGVVVLLWSALKVFRALDIAFDRIYQVDADTPLLRQLLNGTIVVLSITTSLMVLLLVRMSIAWLGVPYANWLGIPLVLLGLIAVLTPLYYVLPPVAVSLPDVLPGALSAVAGLLLLQQLFHYYAAHAGQYSAYGFIGAVLLFLLWLYFGAIILLAGVVVNATLKNVRRTGLSEAAASRSLPVTPHLAVDEEADEEPASDDTETPPKAG